MLFAKEKRVIICIPAVYCTSSVSLDFLTSILFSYHLYFPDDIIPGTVDHFKVVTGFMFSPVGQEAGN